MKFCQPHWDAMRQGVQDRGMWHLVAKSGEEAVAAVVRELERRPAPTDWNPLMAAHWAIAGKVMDKIGESQGPAAALGAMADPNWCPLCSLQQSYDWWDAPGRGARPSNALDAQGWLDSCLDAMLAHARGQKLVPVQQ